MTLIQSPLVDGGVQFYVPLICGRYVVIEAERAFQSGETYVVEQEKRSRLVESFYLDTDLVRISAPVCSVGWESCLV